jgi:uncharacterized protein (TIGR02646 family)
MKAVEKGTSAKAYSHYTQAKPDLLARLGEHCSYCERSAKPQDLHVEHIYPKHPHPELERDWNNFLVACNTCNSYKNLYLGNGRQVNLENRFLWPHRENTCRAYTYKASGDVEIAATVPAALVPAAESTREMVGLLLSPAAAEGFQKLGIAYDGANMRSQMWSMAESFRTTYLGNPTPFNATTIARGAAVMGYFSVWMEVFSGIQEVRRELIIAFKADPSCFDAETQPVPKGRL